MRCATKTLVCLGCRTNFRATRLLTLCKVCEFWTKVKVQPGCWEWLGTKSYQGRGMFGLNAYQPEQAARLMYMLKRGDPGDLLVLHTCDNLGCVNPAHLELGTQSKNIQDAWDRGRNELRGCVAALRAR